MNQKMNDINVKSLLSQWEELLDTGELVSIEKAEKTKDGIDGRIKRAIGVPVVFDFDTYEKQLKIQDSLCKKLPELAECIRSIPEIMDGHPWTRRDFIELYFKHYRLVIYKLKRLINARVDM